MYLSWRILHFAPHNENEERVEIRHLISIAQIIVLSRVYGPHLQQVAMSSDTYVNECTANK